MIEFLECSHLIFDKDILDKRMKLVPLPGNIGVYWERPDELLPDNTCHKEVQYCNLRGRLNSKVACLKGMAECSLYKGKYHNEFKRTNMYV